MNILTHSITSTPTDGRLIQDLGLNVYRVLTVSDSAVFTVNVCCNIIKHCNNNNNNNSLLKQMSQVRLVLSFSLTDGY